MVQRAAVERHHERRRQRTHHRGQAGGEGEDDGEQGRDAWVARRQDGQTADEGRLLAHRGEPADDRHGRRRQRELADHVRAVQPRGQDGRGQPDDGDRAEAEDAEAQAAPERLAPGRLLAVYGLCHIVSARGAARNRSHPDVQPRGPAG